MPHIPGHVDTPDEGDVSFEAFRRWVVSRVGGARAESITPENFREHNLYLFFKASTTPFVPGVGAEGALTQFDPTAPGALDPTASRPFDPLDPPEKITSGPLAEVERVAFEAAFPPEVDEPRVGRPESERPLPGETAAEWRLRLDRQSAILGDPVQEEHLGRRGFWNAQGQFVSTNEFGEREIIDFDPNRIFQQPPPGETEAQRAQREQQQQQFETTQQRLLRESEADRLFREQQFEFQGETRRLEQEQFRQGLAGQREERLAQLAAQPISWLQHAALSGQQPVVQPWMIPLMRPGQNLQVGQPIPGFQPGAPGAAQQGGFIPGTATPAPVGNQFANPPELRRPSAQLFARMGPTAQQQFLGFRQARTGIPPEETLFRQRQSGPPGSSGGGFQQQRVRV